MAFAERHWPLRTIRVVVSSMFCPAAVASFEAISQVGFANVGWDWLLDPISCSGMAGFVNRDIVKLAMTSAQFFELLLRPHWNIGQATRMKRR
jgi:hypothetical protein